MIDWDRESRLVITCARGVAPVLAAVNQYALRCPTSFVQYAALAAFQKGAPFVEEMRAEYARRRDAVAAGLNAIDGVICPIPEGTFYAFAQFDPNWGDSRDLANYLLNEHGVLLTPGSAYGPASQHHLRLSFATSLDLIEDGLGRMAKALPPVTRSAAND